MKKDIDNKKSTDFRRKREEEELTLKDDIKDEKDEKRENTNKISQGYKWKGLI